MIEISFVLKNFPKRYLPDTTIYTHDPIYLKPRHNFAHLFQPIDELDFPSKDIILALPLEKNWIGSYRKYQGFWQPEGSIPPLIFFQQSFKPLPGDIFVTSFPKSGTTWLKSIVFATLNRMRYDFAAHPLLRLNPHDCVRFIEHLSFEERNSYLESLPSPRALGTHCAYSVLPNSVKESECKIVYICRDPKDVLVSMWYMFKTRRDGSPVPFSEAFELLCEGRSPCGSIWETDLEYWNESLRNPKKILFLKYEDLIDDALRWVEKIADFLGYSFSEDEKMEGIPTKIVDLCSLENLKGLDVNKRKNGNCTNSTATNHIYFRKGGIGDWRNHMSLEMAERIDAITKEKLERFGLSFSSSTMN